MISSVRNVKMFPYCKLKTKKKLEPSIVRGAISSGVTFNNNKISLKAYKLE